MKTMGTKSNLPKPLEIRMFEALHGYMEMYDVLRHSMPNYERDMMHIYRASFLNLYEHAISDVSKFEEVYKTIKAFYEVKDYMYERLVNPELSR